MIALIDPHSGGHHDVFLKMFVRTLQREGCEVAVLSPLAQNVVESLESDRGVTWKEWHPEFLRSQASGSCGAPWIETAEAIESLDCSLGRMPDFAFLASLDSYLGHWQSRKSVDRCFPVQFSGLFLHPWMFRIPMRYRWLRRFWLDPLEPLRAKRCASVCVLDSKVAPAVSRRLARPAIVFPDLASTDTPPSSSPVAAELIEKANGRSTVILTGVIDGRKGIDRFLNLAERSDPHEWFFAIVGPVDWNSIPSDLAVRLKGWTGSRANGWMAETRHLGDDEINELVACASVVWLAYDRFPFSSNLLSKAVAFRTPVLTNGEFLIGERVREFGLGLALGSEFDVAGFSRDIRKQILDLGVSDQFQEGCQRYGLTHSPDVLQEAFKQVLSCSPDPVLERRGGPRS